MVHREYFLGKRVQEHAKDVARCLRALPMGANLLDARAVGIFRQTGQHTGKLLSFASISVSLILAGPVGLSLLHIPVVNCVEMHSVTQTYSLGIALLLDIEELRRRETTVN